MSGPIFIELSSCIIGTVMELLSIDYIVQQKHVGITALTSTAALSIHLTMEYILCFYAEKFTTLSFQMTDLIYCDLLWYEMSIDEQQLIILPIQQAQKHFHLEGYGIYNANMETFMKV